MNLKKIGSIWRALFALWYFAAVHVHADESRSPFRLSAGEGTVVMSATLPAQSSERHSDISLLYRRVYSSNVDTVPVNHGYLFDRYDAIVEDGMRTGRLVVLTLAAGRYEFYGYRRPPAMSVQRYPNADYLVGSPIRFVVMPGRISYAGNLELRFDLSAEAEWFAKDERDRDMSIFFARHPELNIEQIHFQQLK
jgi:hypothetical protein